MKKQYYPTISYSQLLLDPRWQKKRLEILSRDDFTCQLCSETEETLHIHHTYYRKGNMPWEYPDCSLVTLCKDCHEHEGSCLYQEKQAMIESFCKKGFGSTEFNMIACALQDSTTTLFKGNDLAIILSMVIETQSLQEQAAEAYKTLILSRGKK